MIEEMARIPVTAEYASEFRYRNPVLAPNTLVMGISQSGETADTLAALREARRRGCRIMGIVNVVGSTIAAETDFGVYLHAGPEIGVASTKAFSSQVVALALFTLYLARRRNMSILEGRKLVRALQELPAKVEEVLRVDDRIRRLAAIYRDAPNFLYLGRGYQFPVALEGALKLKEVSYIHAEGYPAAEMKHGPIALIDENMPVVVLAPRDGVYAKTLSNIEEVRARRGRVIAVATDRDAEVAARARRRDRGPRHDSGAHARARHGPAPAPGLPRGGDAGMRRGPAAQPRQIGDGRVRVVLQRVGEASVEVEGGVAGAIGPGLVVLAGIADGDGPEKMGWMANKVVNLRIFGDEAGRMNRSVLDTGGEVLVVSQFTLCGDARKGRRPSFVHAARREVAIPLYERFLAELEALLPGKVQCGRFGARMKVALVNDGPVTLVVER